MKFNSHLLSFFPVLTSKCYFREKEARILLSLIFFEGRKKNFFQTYSRQKKQEN